MNPFKAKFSVDVSVDAAGKTDIQVTCVSSDVPAPVVTPPAAPVLVSAVAGNAKADLVWTPPAVDGGSALTGYIIAYGASTLSVGPAVTSAAVSGLTNGVPVAFSLKAVNAVGPSPASNSISVTPTAPVVVPPTASLWVSAYYAGWFPDMYPESKIDYSAMTHLFVGRASVSTPTGTIKQALDMDNTRGMSRALALSTAAHAAGKKAVIMLGGMNEGVNFASASTPANRAAFVSNILAFVDATGMDGVDLDWEENINYPDWLALCQALRAARPSLIITLCVFPVNNNFGLTAVQKSFFASVHGLVNQINAMTYGIGMAGPWGGWVTWHTGALDGEAGNRPTSISNTLEHYVAAGVPKNKMGMGIGFYGINFGVPNTDPLQTPGPIYQADDVEWRYSQVVKYVNARPANRKWDNVAKMNYMSFPGGFTPNQPGYPGGTSIAGFLSYEDEASIAAKGAWCKANGYGGTILWTINYSCTNTSTGANPLLAAAKAAFL